jgi:hypothetical protein
MKKHAPKIFVACALVLALGAVHAQALVNSTAAQTNLNVLTLGSGTTGYSFSGMTGDFSPVLSSQGYYYADYLFSFTPNSVAESVTITLNSGSGVKNLSERIYAGNSFLGDTATPVVQGWTSNYLGTQVSYIAPTLLQAGTYVLEIRGKSIGAFGGTLELTPQIAPVPEPETIAMLLGGLGLVGAMVRRRKAV